MAIYPIPTESWIRSSGLVQAPEDMTAVGQLFDRLRSKGRTTESAQDALEGIARSPRNLDLLFSVLLAHLYFVWWSIRSPQLALEFLVSDFSQSEAVWVGNGELPARVAGIGETDDFRELPNDQQRALSDGCRQMCRKYVLELCDAGLLSRSSLLIREIEAHASCSSRKNGQ